MTNFVYTDTMYPLNSSVIDSAFYDATSKTLVVVLHNGTKAGYKGVGDGVWSNFKRELDLNGSVGSYWNTWIKPHFEGFSTTDIVDYLTEGELDGGTWGTTAINRELDGPAVEVSEADESDAPEIDTNTGPTSLPGAVVTHPVDDVKAGPDLGQRSYEITYEVVTVQTHKSVVYAANDVEAENDFLRDFDEVKVVDVRRRF